MDDDTLRDVFGESPGGEEEQHPQDHADADAPDEPEDAAPDAEDNADQEADADADADVGIEAEADEDQRRDQEADQQQQQDDDRPQAFTSGGVAAGEEDQNESEERSPDEQQAAAAAASGSASAAGAREEDEGLFDDHDQHEEDEAEPVDEQGEEQERDDDMGIEGQDDREPSYARMAPMQVEEEPRMAVVSRNIPVRDFPKRKRQLNPLKLTAGVKFVGTPFVETRERDKERLDEERQARWGRRRQAAYGGMDARYPPEATIRWRFKMDANGQILRDSKTGNPVRETNTHLVRYKDGKCVLFIGSEPYLCTEHREEHLHFFDDTDGVKALHGPATSRLTLKPPVNFQLLVKKPQTNKGKAARAIMETTPEEAEAAQKRTEEQLEDSRMATAKRKRKMHEADMMDSSFLEDDSNDEGSDTYERGRGSSKRRR
ncbi:unnamed protein product [Vitrella brassicaformis CCMP3155]|uniref:RNA polymerase-associated protein LEO1 n=2 Tax=Vitrella brassicaformis TaxID=1169539 RepID=A0A0G4ESY7_VITBC|nr:unnamed protein product [Vitrella brassicaformis CCMP3155]|eukprot:CEM01526.1 unnamed protein product [Vitrella brassicaformis CCMP3155]